MIKAFGASDVGCVRELNEDCFCLNIFDADKNEGFFILADGMGGHNAGEVASQTVVKYIADKLMRLKEDDIPEKEIPSFISHAIEEANDHVYKMALENDDQSGMGTTAVVAVVKGDKIFIANVGDSRAYSIKENDISRITIDHSVVEELVLSGMITEEEARNHPQKNIITRAVGTDKEVDVDLFEKESEKETVLMLCSDGLCSMLDDKEILEIVTQYSNCEEAVQMLINRAKQNGGLDNITVIFIRFI